MKIKTEKTELFVLSYGGVDFLYQDHSMIGHGSVLFFDEPIENFYLMDFVNRAPGVGKYLVLISNKQEIIYQSSKIIQINL